MFNSNFFHSEKGSALFFAIVALALLLGVGVGLSTLFVGELQIAGGRGGSLLAFYAAETGIERTLRVDWCLFMFSDPEPQVCPRVDCLEDVIGIRPPTTDVCPGGGGDSPSLHNQWDCGNGPPGNPYDEDTCRTKSVEQLQDTSLPNGATYAAEIVTSGCGAGIFCAESTGTFQGVSRKIEVER